MKSLKLGQKTQRTNQNNEKINNNSNGKSKSEIENLQIKPWASSRLAKITACMMKKTGNNIFCLSNRSSNSNTKVNSILQNEPAPKTYSFKTYHKPRTAPHNNSHKRRQKSTYLSQEMVRLGPVVTEQVLDDNFEQNLESINFYPQFRASVQQRKNLFLLKPYIKSHYRQRKQFNISTFDGIQKLKTELYKGIKQSHDSYQDERNQNKESIESQNKMQLAMPRTNRSSVIEYMTEYTGSAENDQQSTLTTINKEVRAPNPKHRHGSISIAREKLKNRYKQSEYADKISKIKRGEGVPITIIK